MDVRLTGYVRCSTREQCPDRQIIALKEFGVPENAIVIEMKSGKDFDRPAYQRMIKKLMPGDILVVDSLDRLGRDRYGVVEEWRRITKEKSADIVVLDMLPLLDTRRKEQDITQSFVADLVLQVLCYVCEKERLLNRERTAAGIAAAKERGVIFGRRPMSIHPNFPEIRAMWECGEISENKASKRLGISRQTFQRWVRINAKP